MNRWIGCCCHWLDVIQQGGKVRLPLQNTRKYYLISSSRKILHLLVRPFVPPNWRHGNFPFRSASLFMNMYWNVSFIIFDGIPTTCCPSQAKALLPSYTGLVNCMLSSLVSFILLCLLLTERSGNFPFRSLFVVYKHVLKCFLYSYLKWISMCWNISFIIFDDTQT